MVSLLAQSIPAALANPTPPAWRVLSKAGYFVGLIGVIGGCLLHLVVLRPVLSRSSVAAADREILQRRCALLLAGAGAFMVIALYFQFAGLIARAKGSTGGPAPYGDALSPWAMWTYVTAPGSPAQWISPGAMAAIQYGLWALAGVVLMLPWVRRARPTLTAVASIALAITLFSHQLGLLPTNLNTVSADGVVDTVANHVHVLGVCAWIGGLATLVGLSTARRRLGEGAGAVWAQLWSRFATVALIAVGCVVVSGMYMTWTLVGAPDELFTTKFGNVLLVKVALVAAIVLIGASHEFVLIPRMARARAAGDDGSVFGLALRTVPLLATAEVVLAVGALLAMTFLNGSARAQAGDGAPSLSAGVIGLGVLLVVVLAGSFIVTAKLSERFASAARAPGH